MKKVVGQLINPNTPTGQQFRDASLSASGASCINMRQWIVPKPSTVYELDCGLYRPVLPGNLNDPAMAVPVATSRNSFWYVAAAPLVLWLLAACY